MWIPHSSFCPCQRPDRGSDGSSGSEVHGSQPMLVYPRSYSGSSGMSCAFAYNQTSLVVHAARALTFVIDLPDGRRNGSTSARFARDADCCRRSPVNQTSYASSAEKSGSTLWRAQHASVLVCHSPPEGSAARRLTTFSFHRSASSSR